MSNTKKQRRTKAQIENIRAELYNLIAVENPMSVRQVFYRAVSLGIVNKSETEYSRTVGRLLVDMRRNGEIPYDWIADATRWMRKPRTNSSLGECIDACASVYRRSIWDDQPVYTEIWIEKEALAGVIYPVTAEWDVPLMVVKGYSSLSFLYEAGLAISNEDKPVHLYYFGDFDPTGVDISRKIEAELRGFAPDTELYFHRVAVNEDQIAKWNLPTRPTKKTDPRAKAFGNRDSVEVDAIPPNSLRDLVRGCIEQHVDSYQLHQLKRIEAAERATFTRFAQYFLNRESNTKNYDDYTANPIEEAATDEQLQRLWKLFNPTDN